MDAKVREGLTKVVNFIKNPTVVSVLFFISLFMLCLAFSTLNDVIDVDFWSRLLMGKHVFQTGTVMKQDIISYAPTHVWYDHEWLSSTVFYMVSTAFGPLGLNVFKTILCFLLILSINLVVEQNQGTKNYKYKYIYLFIVALWFFRISVFDKLRCQHITYILIPIFIYFLEKARINPKTKTIWLLPLIMLVWLNCHGGAVVGVGFILMYALGEAVLRRPCKQYFLVLIPTILVWLINPWGIDFILFMKDALFVDREWIAEWQSPFTFEKKELIIFISSTVLIAAIYIYSQIRNKIKLKNINIPKILILVIVTYFAYKHIKHCFLYFICAFSYIYEDFKTVLDDILKLLKKLIKIEFPVYPLFIVAAFIYSIYIYSNYSLSESYYKKTTEMLPLQALQFLKDNGIKGKIFAPYYLSGFIGYKEYPDFKIHMDGREEQVYEDGLFRNEMNFLFYRHNRSQRVIEKYNPDVILLENAWGANGWLRNSENNYKLVYDDGLFSVFLRKDLVRFSFKMPDGIRDYTRRRFFDTKLDFRKH